MPSSNIPLESVAGMTRWLADMLKPDSLQRLGGTDLTAQNAPRPELRAEMAALSPPPARCAVCRREYTRTYANNGVYIWDHADGTSCREPAPNHLQYWARELDRPIETRSIEEQQRDRERRIAADRESARRANAAAQISDGAFPNIVEAEEQWNRWAPFKVEKPEPKKLPIAKPMKRVFNFASD